MDILYHYTRLLPQEKTLIQGKGLCPLSNLLIENKIKILREYGVNSEYLNFSRNVDERPNNICFVTQSFENIDIDDVSNLYENWGGEILRHDIFDVYNVNSIQERLNKDSASYQISVNIRDLGLDIYESFSSDPMPETILHPNREYQIKDTIHPDKLIFTEI